MQQHSGSQPSNRHQILTQYFISIVFLHKVILFEGAVFEAVSVDRELKVSGD